MSLYHLYSHDVPLPASVLTVTIGVAITVKFIVRILSQPAAFGIVSLYIPVTNQVCLPLGEVYVSHTFAVIVSVVSEQNVIFRMRWFDSSATYTFPAPSTATPVRIVKLSRCPCTICIALMYHTSERADHT